MIVKHSATITAGHPDDYLLAEDLRTALADAQIPPGAQVAPILRERGTQREPVTVLVGLMFTWTSSS